MLESSQNPGSAAPYESPVNAGPPIEPAMLGRSLVIKGEVSGAEPLYIEGSVEGTIRVDGQRLTVGRGSHVKADISAQEVVILGEVKGNVQCGDRLDIRRDGRLTGDARMRSLSVEDGAVLKGSFEICKNGSNLVEEPTSKVIHPQDVAPIVVEKPDDPHPSANELSASSVCRASRVRGSRVLYQEVPKN